MRQILYKAAVDDTIGGGGARRRSRDAELMAAQYAAMANNTPQQQELLRNAVARQAAAQGQMATTLSFEQLFDVTRRQDYLPPERTPPPEPEKPNQAKDNEFTL